MAKPTPGDVTIKLFGALEIAIGERQIGIAALGGSRPKQVLEILLVARGHPVSTDRLADLLWGHKLPLDAAGSLQTFISVLRRHLTSDPAWARALVVTDPQAYRFDTSLVTLDLDRFDVLLERPSRESPRVVRRRLEHALTLVRGDVLDDEPYAEWALELRRVYQTRVLEARLDAAQMALAECEYTTALRHAEKAIDMDRLSDRAHRLAMLALYALGRQHEALHAFTQLRTVLDEELGLELMPDTRALHSAIVSAESPSAGYAGYAVPGALQGLGWLAFWEGNEEEAGRLFADSLAQFEELGDQLQAAGSLFGMAQLASRGGDQDRAQACCERALAVASQLNDRWLVSVCLQGLGRIAVAAGSVNLGAQLLSAAERARQDTGTQWTPFVRSDYERAVASAQAELGEHEFTGAWAAGQLLTPEQAALAADGAAPARTGQNELTPRELEVLRLVARGLSDAEVSDRLVVSRRTVHSHLRSIYRKLGVTSRGAATRYVVEHDLAM